MGATEWVPLSECHWVRVTEWRSLSECHWVSATSRVGWVMSAPLRCLLACVLGKGGKGCFLTLADSLPTGLIIRFPSHRPDHQPSCQIYCKAMDWPHVTTLSSQELVPMSNPLSILPSSHYLVLLSNLRWPCFPVGHKESKLCAKEPVSQCFK